ncbi:hypothetical protein BAUCODRAFT_25017 [Baudoinia panamericana UAMH 10762]|uniref:Major facilitator superfamily (MFS) profile domain-containing protein n=1 Tax=Baudoinia panamericana (strain UAMH 10762) TaxID=717646 RepID=M2NAB6_BAUPA|nr:uncharacterized protein BAUCODRAFT_25017 [Baudoinia panamericana UAMH 10762]EMC96069.1 hypothetical protein BAUCODRAFT_25017 [Baudoinia panamericana UAMH 10762]
MQPDEIQKSNIAAMHVERPDVLAIEHEEDVNYSVGVRTSLAIIALALANCCATLSNTTNTIIKFQVIAVGGAAEASWIANGNFLLTLACGPIFGSLADRLGKKWFIVGGAAVGVAGSFISASGKDVFTIIAGNVLTGIANAGCIVAIPANQEIIPNRFRPYAFGFAQTVNSAAAVAGVFTAAAFAQYSTWAWSYRLNGIVYAVSALSVLALYQPPPTAIRRSASIREILLGVDYIGMVLLAGSFACIVLGLTWGGTAYPWRSGIIIGTLTGGCAGLVIFGLFEWLVKREGALLDRRLFGSPNFPILCFVCLIDGMLLLGINVLYAQEIGDLFASQAVRIAVILSPFLITSTVGCLPAGYAMGRTKSYRILLVASLLWCSLFTGLMGLINPSRLSVALAMSALFGIGTAVTTVLPLVALGLSVPSFLLGTAGTLSISARALGGIVGVTVFTAIYNNKYAVYMPRAVITALQNLPDSQQIVPAVIGALSSPLPPPVALQTVQQLPASMIGPVLGAISVASAMAWKYVWIAIACVVLAGAFSSCFLKPVNAEMNSHVESALEKSVTREKQLHGNEATPDH